MSEENNFNDVTGQQDPQSLASENITSWEAQLQTRANALITLRVSRLKTEIEQLQSTINEINGRLLQQIEAEPAPDESSELVDHVKQWLSDLTSKAEEEFQSKLLKATGETASQTREQAEQEFHARLEEARGQWEIATQEAQEANEEAFQKRLEQACAEAAAVVRRESEARIEEIREQLEASRKALTLAVASAQANSAQPNGFDRLRSAVEEIDLQRSQSETLAALVRCASQFAPRAIFFVVKGSEAVGWKAHGFENGLDDETVRQLSIPIQNPSLLHEALVNFRTVIGRSSSPGEESPVLGIYGSPAPDCAIAIPLVVRGKAAATLYVDSGTQSENSINTAALETLIRAASMCIELLPARRGLDTPRPSQPPIYYKAPSVSRFAAVQSISSGPAVAPAIAPEPSTSQTESSMVVEEAGPAEPEPEQARHAEPEQIYQAEPEPERIHQAEPEQIHQAEPEQIHQAEPEQIHQAEPEQIHQAEPEQIHQAEPEQIHQAEPEPIHHAEPEPEQIHQAEPEPELVKYIEAEFEQTSEQTIEPAQVAFPQWAERVRMTGELISPPEVHSEAQDGLQEAETQSDQPEAVEAAFSISGVAQEEAQSEYVAIEPEPFQDRREQDIPRIPPPPPAPPVSPAGFSEMLSSAPTVQVVTPRQTMALPREQDLGRSPDTPSFGGGVSYSTAAESPRQAQSSAAAPSPANETEQRAHNDARRFARLLVSEIKLYNAAKVNEGRRNFDLYDRLKDEIDRSRKVYDKRVSPSVASRFDYFYDELVQTLAEGDPAKLGPGCPGPVVLAS